MADAAHPVLGPLPRSSPHVADDIARHLERLIVSGALPPGRALPPERALALDLGVSRNALREGLTRLAGLGLLDRRQGSGNRVSRTIPLTATLADGLRAAPAEFEHSAEFRSVIEPRIARLAAERIDPTGLTALGELLTDADRETDSDRSAALDIAFHTALAQATGNPLLATLGQLIASWTVEARVFSHLEDEGRTLSRTGHGRILAAARAGDAEAADYAMRIHLAEIRDVIEKVRTAEASEI